MIHTKRIGTQGELLVCEDLLSRGYDVFTSVGDYTAIDIVAIKEHQIIRLQVKTNINTSKGWMYVNAAHGQNGKTVLYKKDDFDYIAGCAIDRRTVVYVPFKRLLPPHSRSIVLRFDKPKTFKGKVNYVTEFQTITPVAEWK